MLSRSAIAAAMPLHQPGSPSLAPGRSSPRAWRALPRRPVLRDPPTSAGPSAFVLSSSGLPATAGTRQISRGKSLRFRGDHVANTPPAPTGTGHRRRRPAHPPQGRLTALHSRSPPPRIYGFFQTRPHGSPPARPAASKPPGELRAAPLPHRCWVPPVRAPVQDSHLRSQQHARHTRLAPTGLASIDPHTRVPTRYRGGEFLSSDVGRKPPSRAAGGQPAALSGLAGVVAGVVEQGLGVDDASGCRKRNEQQQPGGALRGRRRRGTQLGRALQRLLGGHRPTCASRASR
jgi:hypothetical protein